MSNSSSLMALVAKIQATSATLPPPSSLPKVIQEPNEELHEEIIRIDEDNSVVQDKYGNTITYNSKQLEAVNLAASGKSFVLIGPAGTGKTTSMKGAMQALIQSGKAGILDAGGHKYLQSSVPGIVICAYTRRAVANIRKNLPKDLQNNAITIHKLLEYEPVYTDVIDEATGETKTKMEFLPARNCMNPLPSSIRAIVFEETSMLSTELYKEVIDACPHKPQLIFIGDIQQLPPVFGPAILGFKLLQLPVVELTEVYRQALESPIISLAHRILSGKGIPAKDFPDWNKNPLVTLKPWKKKISPDEALNTIALMFCGNKHKERDTKKHVTGLHEGGFYNPEDDIILLPFNKSCGTDELNKHIANYLARVRKAEVFQVIAGFNKYHFSVGDKVMFEKEDATIIKIEATIGYTGAKPVPSSVTLDYWGFESDYSHKEEIDVSDEDVDFLLSQVASADSEDRVRKSSHTLTLKMNDSDTTIKVDTASAINSLILGYALTVHKAQGSEWRKVFFITHNSHATMLQRELLYTAVTRAREELFIVCEPEAFVKGIESQRVKGNTLAEKAEFFKGKITAGFNLEGY